MQVCGNGRRININSRYNTTLIRVWEEGSNKVYTVELEYEKASLVWQVVGDVVQNHGKDKNFWSILGDTLASEFVVLDLNKKEPKKKATPIEIEKEGLYKEMANVVTEYAKINYSNNTVQVKLKYDGGENIIAFKYRKTWSHRKYVDMALDKSKMIKSWNFKYGWEIA